MSCCPSTISRPSFCRAKSTGNSMMSMPTGSLCRPRFSSSMRIFLDILSAAHLRGHCTAQHRNSRTRAVSEPGTVQLMMLGGGSEIPQDRFVILGQQREAVRFVLRPRADVRRRQIAHVVHVETKERAHRGFAEQIFCLLQTFAAQPVEVDSVLPIHRHRSVCFECHKIL